MDTAYLGHQVIDQYGDPVGTVSDVFYDDQVNKPMWLVVDPGRLRKGRLVPLDGTYETDNGAIMVPFDKHWIKQAPTVSGDGYPDMSVRRLAAQHFDLHV